MIIKKYSRYLSLTLYIVLLFQTNIIYSKGVSEGAILKDFKETIMNNDIVKTQELLKKHPKISKNNEVKDNFDAFYYSVLNNKFTIVRVLLESGFDPNHKDQDMVSMLHWAAAKELVGIATLLIEKGANVSIRDSRLSSSSSANIILSNLICF